MDGVGGLGGLNPGFVGVYPAVLAKSLNGLRFDGVGGLGGFILGPLTDVAVTSTT